MRDVNCLRFCLFACTYLFIALLKWDVHLHVIKQIPWGTTVVSMVSLDIKQGFSGDDACVPKCTNSHYDSNNLTSGYRDQSFHGNPCLYKCFHGNYLNSPCRDVTFQQCI